MIGLEKSVLFDSAFIEALVQGAGGALIQRV